ncbi:hypothetical protein [Spiroplasma endosymbiont of Polydrusus pterygomalis]|uniref:hypothetical protein n=1 Tax=Spiroplasma endosymbiont of Polydrusus pterygomalis TaxID=3139327 RepID=UPI003CCAA38F
MLDFRKYFTDKNAIDNKNDGDFFTVMVKSIIAENGQRNNKNVEDILKQLAVKETEDFHEFKLAIEQQIKMLLFVNISNLLRNWEKKYITKINALERKEKYTHQNVPDGKFKNCYSIFQKNNEYFHGDYHSAIVAQTVQELKEIYKVLDKEDDFSQTEYLLELLITFQESISNTNQATKKFINQLKIDNEYENKEWEIINDQEISTVKSNNATIEIELHDQLNKKIIAKNKISKFRNFIIKIFTFGKINKHKQIKQEIANIKKQLQDNAKNKEDENNKAIKLIISEVNQAQTQATTSNNTIKNEQRIVTKQSPTL